MPNKPINSFVEKALFEHNISLNLERYLRYDLINFRDICRFSPKMFSEFVRVCTTSSQDISMAKDGVYHYATDKHDRKYFVDIMSGLVLLQNDDSFSVATHSCTSKHFDIFDAAYLRQYILNPERRTQRLFIANNEIGEITTLHYLGNHVADIFAAPIPEYTVSSRNELEDLIEDLTTILSRSKFFRKLWFRGQRTEYTVERSENTTKRLGFPKEFTCMPSLMPSAGRSTDPNNYQEMRLMSMYWTTAFNVWLLSQTDGVKPEFKIDAPMYREMLGNLEPTKMACFLRDNPYDIDEYVYAQDEEPLWASVLSAQQYGGCTSMLDITDDIDIALFFTQSQLNTATRKYDLCKPTSQNIIYLLASTRGSSTIDLSKNIFGNIPYEGAFPIPPRILNQRCGLLRGADMFSKNTYAYRILAKIKISGPGIETTKTVDEMFPGIDIDTLYKTYSYATPSLKGLYG